MKKVGPRRVFVGMSGGVDSSVSAALLLRDGYDVIGVFIKTWSPEWQVCTWREERLDAMRVAAKLKIPLITLDLEKEYKRDVADYMIAEYRAGNVPNPDVMCNKTIKFGAFFDFAMSHGADFVATGHYADIYKEAPRELSLSAHGKGGGFAIKDNSRFTTSGKREIDPVSEFPSAPVSVQGRISCCQLTKSTDAEKDQTYFLWTLGQRELSKTIFPIGGYKKSEVRKLAKKFDLPVAKKKDSQGLCFMGKINVKDFLKHYIKEKRGDVLNEQGEVIGNHDGATFFALGERHGFIINKKTPDDRPYYIVAKDIKKNILIVSNNKSEGDISKKEILLKNVNWNQGVAPIRLEAKLPSELDARIRYCQELQKCQVENLKGGKYKVIFDKGQIAPSSGQSVVFYQKNICLGGGVIV